ncbi:MAG: beta-phosphoglucomutase [Bacilli bacterium]|nr:beta-phosphoglucomutase [Bacilli bacterium]MBN2876798.1 beta-phosphoglucomutase [Bacilli bacterium]
MTTIKGVIFDLDGVIVSTDEFHYKAWKKLADRENIPFDKTINNRLRGVSRAESLEIILEKAKKEYTDSQKQEMLEFKNDIYKESLSELKRYDILDNFNELYEQLKENNIKMAIGSSSKNTKRILKQIELSDAFDAIADGTDITRSKPDPEVFLIAAKRLGLNPEECVVIEDAIAGIEAAKAGQMTAIAINDAKNCDKADYRIDNLLEIADIVIGGYNEE